MGDVNINETATKQHKNLKQVNINIQTSSIDNGLKQKNTRTSSENKVLRSTIIKTRHQDTLR